MTSEERSSRVPFNSFEYFQKALIKPTGFREYDVRWLLGEEINMNGMLRLGQAFGTFHLRPSKGRPRLDTAVVGHDFREYSQNVKNAFVIGLLSTGMNVIDIGLTVTPGLYFAQYHLDIHAGAMITASHNENGWTGIKLAHGLSKTFEPPEIEEFRAIVEKGDFAKGSGRYDTAGTNDAYIDDLAGSAKLGRKLKTVIATGNGTAGLFTPEVFRRIGCEVIEVHTEADWTFPNFNPNPENMKFLESIGEAVRTHRADCGIGLDGDGDRLGVVDDRGELIFSDKVGVLIARFLIPKVLERKGKPVFVADVKSTSLFEKLLVPMGAEIHWEKTGHSYIKAAVRNHKATAGMERSGHMFFNQPFGRGYDDGTLAGLRFVEMVASQPKRVSELLYGLPRSYQSPNMQPRCADEVKRDVVARIQKAYEAIQAEKMPLAGRRITKVITINGIRAHFDDDSWFLVRASSNTPTLVVLGESYTTRRRLYDMMEEVIGRLRAMPEIGEFDQTMPEYKGE